MTGLPGQDGQEKAARIWMSARNCNHKTPMQNRRERTARTGQIEQASQSGIASM
jgi:hypothetical protein